MWSGDRLRMGTRGKDKDLDKGLSTPDRTPKVSGMDRTILPWLRCDAVWAVVGLVIPDPFLPIFLLDFLLLLYILYMDGELILM